MILDMHTRSMSSCEQLSSLLRGLVPAPVLCALAALLLPTHVVAQAERPARPAPAPSALEAAAGDAALPAARAGGSSEEAFAGVPLPLTNVGEALLARALGGPPSGEDPGSGLSSLRDFLPFSLYRDVVELRDRVVRVRSRVFGRRGIVSLGRADEDGEVGRLRLNLQYSPDPGIRVTLVTP